MAHYARANRRSFWSSSPLPDHEIANHDFNTGIHTQLTLDGQKQAAAKMDEILEPVAAKSAKIAGRVD